MLTPNKYNAQNTFFTFKTKEIYTGSNTHFARHYQVHQVRLSEKIYSLNRIIIKHLLNYIWHRTALVIGSWLHFKIGWAGVHIKL